MKLLNDSDVRTIIASNLINDDKFGMVRDAERLTLERLTDAALNVLAALCLAAALLVGALSYFDILTK